VGQHPGGGGDGARGFETAFVLVMQLTFADLVVWILLNKEHEMLYKYCSQVGRTACNIFVGV
jgi:hypothetical protein